MKNCLECGTQNAAEAATCVACGGGSWPAAGSRRPPPMPESVPAVAGEDVHDPADPFPPGDALPGDLAPNEPAPDPDQPDTRAGKRHKPTKRGI